MRETYILFADSPVTGLCATRFENDNNDGVGKSAVEPTARRNMSGPHVKPLNIVRRLSWLARP